MQRDVTIALMFSGITRGDTSWVQPNDGNVTKQTAMDGMIRARTVCGDLGEQLLLNSISCFPWDSSTG